jgi:hypothetical protein
MPPFDETRTAAPGPGSGRTQISVRPVESDV